MKKVEILPIDDEILENKISTMHGHFKLYYVYIEDGVENKKYLNLSFGDTEGLGVKISSELEPVAATKLDKGEGWHYWNIILETHI